MALPQFSAVTFQETATANQRMHPLYLRRCWKRDFVPSKMDVGRLTLRLLGVTTRRRRLPPVSLSRLPFGGFVA